MGELGDEGAFGERGRERTQGQVQRVIRARAAAGERRREQRECKPGGGAGVSSVLVDPLPEPDQRQHRGEHGDQRDREPEPVERGGGVGRRPREPCLRRGDLLGEVVAQLPRRSPMPAGASRIALGELAAVLEPGDLASLRLIRGVVGCRTSAAAAVVPVRRASAEISAMTPPGRPSTRLTVSKSSGSIVSVPRLTSTRLSIALRARKQDGWPPTAPRPSPSRCAARSRARSAR